MEEIRHAFPNFVPNQVLSSGQLNALRDYLDQQDRLSRVRLTGTGIACGLAIERRGPSGPVSVSEGFGIGTDGYLIALPGGVYTHCRHYRDPDVDEDGIPGYGPWRQRPTLKRQIELLELLTEQMDPSTDKPLTDQLLNDHVIVLYLEISQQDLRTCLVTDCNNKGENQLFTPRLLLVKADDLTRLPGCEPAPVPVRVPRLHSARPLIRMETTADLNGAYAAIVEEVAPELLRAIKESLGRYGNALGLAAEEGRVVDRFKQFIKKLLQQGRADQYLYDLIGDLADGYNEFVESACRWLPDCTLPTDHPRHLMLDHLEHARGYRHSFRPAPTRSHWSGGQVRTGKLLRRLLLMLDSVAMGAAKELRITPSHDEQALLGDRAIPHYLKFGQEELPLWRPDDCCTPGRPWAYHGDARQIDTDYRACSLMRIEGHLGQGWVEQKQNIARYRLRHNAEFDLLVLYLEGPGGRERKALERMIEERAKHRVAEEAFIEFMGKAISQEGLQEKKFKADYAGKARELNVLQAKVAKEKEAWKMARVERRPLCSLGHLEADYGALRLEVLCVLYRLRAALDALAKNRLPKLAKQDGAAREKAIREASENQAAIAKRIAAEGDPAKRAKLEMERDAAASVFIGHEAENRLYLAARSATGKAMVDIAAKDAGAAKEAAARAWETMRNLREDSVDNTVQISESVSVESLRKLIQDLILQLPEQLSDFDLDAFAGLAKKLTLDLLTLRLMNLLKQVISIARSGLDLQRSMLITLSQSLRLEEQDLQHMLLTVLHDCRHTRLAYLYHLYSHHRENDTSRFADFAARHPGMEHLAGVEKGGTFILVAEQDAPEAPVVADFALAGQVSCCCPPPSTLCMPPVAMPEYHIAQLKRSRDGKQYEPVNLTIDVLANDYDPNQHAEWQKGYSRSVELLSERSELGARLSVDRLTGLVSYRLSEVPAGTVDRFRYRLHTRNGSCRASDDGDVLVLLVPEVNPQPALGQIAGRVTWNGTGEPEVSILIGEDQRSVTNHNGEYRIDALEAGSYTLKAVLWKGEVVSDPQTVTVVAGETATANFDLPKEVERKVGQLAVRVTDARSKSPVTHAHVVVIAGRNKPVAELNAGDEKGIYDFGDFPPGSYLIGVEADGYGRVLSDAVVVVVGERALKKLSLIAQKDTFVPDKTRESVVIEEKIPDREAGEKAAGVYIERINKYVDEVDSVADKPSVHDSDSYVKAREFITTTTQDPGLDEKEIIAAYREVSDGLAAAVDTASEEDKAAFKVLLGSVSKSMLDRVSLENPAEVSKEGEAAINAMNMTLSDAGVDPAALLADWKGDQLTGELNVKSADRVKVLASRP